MKKYRVIIREINDYDEMVTRWRLPGKPDKVSESKYDFDEDERNDLISHQHATGKKLSQEVEIYDQVISSEDEGIVKSIIKSANSI